MRSLTTLVPLAVLCIAPVALGSDESLEALIAASHRPLELSDDGLSGAGATFLLETARDAQFLMLGESHGNVETPRLTAALAADLRESGYSVLAVETGPIVARAMKALADEPEPMPAFQEFHGRLPLTVPFFFWEEEVEMLVEARELDYDVWGLDQEFIGSSRFLLGQLVEVAPSDEARDQARTWLTQAERGFEQFMGTGDQSKGFLNATDPAELEAFVDTLPKDAHDAREIVEEIRASAIVYQHYDARRYYLNNHDRIRLMKKHLADALTDAGGLERAPRAIFKFGSVHMGRGYSPMRQLDLGNAAAELAAAIHSESFHVNVLALASVEKDGSRNDWTEDTEYLARFGAHLDEDSWGVFDLRTMRAHFASDRQRKSEPELADLVYRYDALVLAPVFHKATPMIDLPF